MQLPDALQQYYQRFQPLLLSHLPDTFDPLHQAMRYSVLSGGKRLRPLLVYAAGQCVNAPLALLDNAALAVEFIHAYSLIHDDLPAMDNATLRHGQATCHKKFGEAIAILAGDALQSLAFEILAKNNQVQQIVILARAIGAQGMALGQSVDVQFEKKSVTLEEIQQIHRHKTGALMTASVQLGVLCGNHDETIFRALTQFADHTGLAFQIQDDIFDIELSTKTLGKTQGQDVLADKATYPKLLGMIEAKRLLAETFSQAQACLALLSSPTLLQELLNFIEKRTF